jgi:hypothetical protein
MAKKTTALAVKGEAGKLAPMSAEMAAEAKEGLATFATSSPRISFKAGRVTIDKQPVKDNKLPVAVIDTVLVKAYYDKPYEEDSPSSPVCYAFHVNDPAQFTPHPQAPSPQSDKCVGCEHNKFGTALVGKGKACKDIIRVMGVIPSDDDFTGAESRTMDITGNSLKTWNDYVSKLKMIDRSPRTVVTEVSTEPFKAAFRQTFNHHDDLTQEQYASLKTRREQAKEQMMQPWPTMDEADEKPAPKASKKGRKY